jgi:hypothetical protein
MDLVYLIITVSFFVLSWGLLKLSERLMGGEA